VRVRYAARTDVGLKRTHNEDYFALIEGDRLFMVADGMGGHASGDVASKMSTEVVGDFYRTSRDREATWPFPYDATRTFAENRIVTGIRMANARIFEASQTNRANRGMGTTIVVLHLDGDTAYVAHVGDSRCYLLRGDVMEPVTRDHSLLEDWKDARPDLTAEEIRDFPHKNVITRALGMRESVDVDIRKLRIDDGDRFLLCSDGLSGMLEDEEILEVLATADDLEDAVGELIDRANAAGGDDNITAMIVECSY
jgi:serine/threonine protein phosphatase PrpC